VTPAAADRTPRDRVTVTRSRAEPSRPRVEGTETASGLSVPVTTSRQEEHMELTESDLYAELVGR
jgi:hypothetical protein